MWGCNTANIIFKCQGKYVKNKALIWQNSHKENILGHFTGFLHHLTCVSHSSLTAALKLLEEYVKFLAFLFLFVELSSVHSRILKQRELLLKSRCLYFLKSGTCSISGVFCLGYRNLKFVLYFAWRRHKWPSMKTASYKLCCKLGHWCKVASSSYKAAWKTELLFKLSLKREFYRTLSFFIITNKSSRLFIKEKSWEALQGCCPFQW